MTDVYEDNNYDQVDPDDQEDEEDDEGTEEGKDHMHHHEDGIIVTLHSPAEFDHIDALYFPHKESLIACVV
eukprot:CAMPEP_0114350530 /NCGR_PEP_ID=MMETSP0101-20121206/16440_1 /TAXON_ID=38822 ORGANISM="Pteridomonas danica, Strain PT" /NCGR_SAMPLE_ID=MMETSP0101 /ASSEMBLY_ACC=CAM_ASM_000211 /LENGTH=70 /DNA_ID=CAMNT_0001489827 /DNA_START=103 /DNA_END=312 /DNA_ORIENTATION=+